MCHSGTHFSLDWGSCDVIFIHTSLNFYSGKIARLLILSECVEILVGMGLYQDLLVHCQLITVEVWVQSQATLCGICGRQTGLGARFFSKYCWSPCRTKS